MKEEGICTKECPQCTPYAGTGWHKGRFEVTGHVVITPSLFLNKMTGQLGEPTITIAKRELDDWGPGFGLSLDFEGDSNVRLLRDVCNELLQELR